MRFRLPFSAVVLMAVLLQAPASCQANRVWHDVRGGKLRGTFKDLQQHKAVIQTSSKLVRIPFWNLMPSDQKFIARRMRDRRQNDQVPAITDAPRNWLIDGETVTGQLLRCVEPDVWIVVGGRRRQFSLTELAEADASYARNWSGPVVQKTSHDRWDPFVDSERVQEAAAASAPVDEPAVVESAAGETASWLSPRYIRLGVTVLVCVCAFGWRILRRVLRPRTELDF